MVADLERLIVTDAAGLPDDKRQHEIERRQAHISLVYARIEALESRVLLNEAVSWGIEPPSKPEWYAKYNAVVPAKVREELGIKEDEKDPSYLNRLGRAMITKQIRDARRASVKWWIEVLTPVLALAVAFLSLFKDIIVEVLKSLQK